MLSRITVDFSTTLHAVTTKLRQMPKHFATTGWFGYLGFFQEIAPDCLAYHLLKGLPVSEVMMGLPAGFPAIATSSTNSAIHSKQTM